MLDSIDIQGMLSSPPYTPHPTTPFPDTGSTLSIVYSSLTTKQLENETLVMCNEQKSSASGTENSKEKDGPLDADAGKHDGIVVVSVY